MDGSNEEDESREGKTRVGLRHEYCILGLYGLVGCGVLGLIGKLTLGLTGGGGGGGGLGLNCDGLGLETGLGLNTSLYTFLCFFASKLCNTCCNSLM